jgi:HEPN domain-containing protein
MTPTFMAAIPDAQRFLALEPEDLAQIMFDDLKRLSRANRSFQPEHILGDIVGRSPGYPIGYEEDLIFAVYEAVGWLKHQGLLVEDPVQPGLVRFSRRGARLNHQPDLAEFRKARALPIELLPRELADKVHGLFVRGDHDIAVFQAFKEVEVAIRRAVERRGPPLPETCIGTDLARRAFHPDTGALSNTSLASAEREAAAHLIAGAIGHAKNPQSHRTVNLGKQDAARLIVFAGYLLDLVETRASAADIADSTDGR